MKIGFKKINEKHHENWLNWLVRVQFIVCLWNDHTKYYSLTHQRQRKLLFIHTLVPGLEIQFSCACQ